jgi:putative sterol carrier protein
METSVQQHNMSERSAPVPSLAGMSGRIRIDVAGQTTRVLEIENGMVLARPAAGAEDADAVIECEGEEIVAAFSRGELNPIAAVLQGRLRFEGDRAFAVKVFLGLQAMVRPPPESARVLQAEDDARTKQG